MRSGGELKEAVSDLKIEVGKRTHIAGTLAATGKLTVLINGKAVGEAPGHLLPSKPHDGLNVGDDTESLGANYTAPTKLKGSLEDIRIYWGVLNAKGMKAWASK